MEQSGEARFFVGVHGVVIDAGRMLVLRRSALMAYRPGSWDLPGGHLSYDEDLEGCLRREVAEETGLKLADTALLGVNRAAQGPYLQILYACRPRSPVAAPRLRPDEHVEARWVTPAQLAQMRELLVPYLQAALDGAMLSCVKG